jgi:hypothetical protein
MLQVAYTVVLVAVFVGIAGLLAFGVYKLFRLH